MNLVEVISREINRTLLQLDLSLTGTLDALNSPDLAKVSAAGRNLMLFDRSSTASEFSSILVVDETGHVRYDSTSETPARTEISGRERFLYHRDHADPGAFVSRPFQGRSMGGDWAITVSRQISGPDGSFKGIVAGSIRLDYFSGVFANLDLGTDSAITVFHEKGPTVMRLPFRMTLIGKDTEQGLTILSAGQKKPVRAVSLVDGVERIFTTTRIGNSPLILMVGLAVLDVYGPWEARIVMFGFLVATLLIGAATLAALLLREFRNKKRREEDLRNAVAFTEVLASTDGLTGLFNRRSLDDRLEIECEKARAGGMDLACLMIDIDHFKALNDHCGHGYGDQALQSVAEVIRSNLRRPADFAARYGGEEFCILLPETAVMGAHRMAENLREAVYNLRVANLGTPSQHLTVSVGVAVLDHNRHRTPADLLKDADTALYTAKKCGRKCSRFAIDVVEVEDEADRSASRL